MDRMRSAVVLVVRGRMADLGLVTKELLRELWEVGIPNAVTIEAVEVRRRADTTSGIGDGDRW